MGEINWSLIRGEYISALLDTGQCNLVDLANKFKVNINTLRSRKAREKWDKQVKELKKKAKKNKPVQCNASNAMKISAKHCNGASGGSASNSNNKKPIEREKTGKAVTTISDLKKDPRGNNFRHGLYEKFLPAEVQEVINEIQGAGPIDMLIMSAEMLFAQIIRAMRIMHVKNEFDHSKETKRIVGGTSAFKAKEVEYEIQMAWDQQGNFMKALSGSMRELRNIIKTLSELVDDGMANEEQELRIEKLKLEITRLDSEVDTGGDDVAEMIVAAAERRAKNGQD